eukprot:748967-Hanusia_phi.AAC.1
MKRGKQKGVSKRPMPSPRPPPIITPCSEPSDAAAAVAPLPSLLQLLSFLRLLPLLLLLPSLSSLLAPSLPDLSNILNHPRAGSSRHLQPLVLLPHLILVLLLALHILHIPRRSLAIRRDQVDLAPVRREIDEGSDGDGGGEGKVRREEGGGRREGGKEE